MASTTLGTKRECPKCAAKFYDFGATENVTCPKCGKAMKIDDEKKKTRRVKAVKPVPVKKEAKRPLAADDLPDDLPDVDEGDEIEELEPIEEEEVELTSLEEVEEHEEEDEDPKNSDDAEDEMFTEMEGEKLVDDLEDYIETDEDLEEEENEDNDEEE